MVSPCLVTGNYFFRVNQSKKYNMSYACDGLSKLDYQLRYGHRVKQGRVVLPNKPYEECCLKLSDLAVQAKNKFDIPLSSMKVIYSSINLYSLMCCLV